MGSRSLELARIRARPGQAISRDCATAPASLTSSPEPREMPGAHSLLGCVVPPKARSAVSSDWSSHAELSCKILTDAPSKILGIGIDEDDLICQFVIAWKNICLSLYLAVAQSH